MRAGLPVKGMTVASAQNLGLPTSVGSPQGFQGYGSTVGSGGTWRYRWLWHGWRDEYRSWCGRNGRLWLERLLAAVAMAGIFRSSGRPGGGSYWWG